MNISHVMKLERGSSGLEDCVSGERDEISPLPTSCLAAILTQDIATNHVKCNFISKSNYNFEETCLDCEKKKRAENKKMKGKDTYDDG